MEQTDITKEATRRFKAARHLYPSKMTAQEVSNLLDQHCQRIWQERNGARTPAQQRLGYRETLRLEKWMAILNLWQDDELMGWLEVLVRKEVALENQYHVFHARIVGGLGEEFDFRLEIDSGLQDIVYGDPEGGIGTFKRHNNLFVERCRGLGLEPWSMEANLMVHLIEQELQLEEEYFELWDEIYGETFCPSRGEQPSQEDWSPDRYNTDGMYRSDCVQGVWGEHSDGECVPLKNIETVSEPRRDGKVSLGPNHQLQEPETQGNVPWVGSDNPCLSPDTPRDLIPEEMLAEHSFSKQVSPEDYLPAQILAETPVTAQQVGPDELSLPSEVLGNVYGPELLMEPGAQDSHPRDCGEGYVMHSGEKAVEVRLGGKDKIPQPTTDNQNLYSDTPGELLKKVLVKHRAQEGYVMDCGEGKELVLSYREPGLTQQECQGHQESARGTKSPTGAASLPALAKEPWVQCGTIVEGEPSGEIPWITNVQRPTGTDTAPKAQLNLEDWDKGTKQKAIEEEGQLRAPKNRLGGNCETPQPTSESQSTVIQPKATEEVKEECKHSLGGNSVVLQAATQTDPGEENQEGLSKDTDFQEPEQTEHPSPDSIRDAGVKRRPVCTLLQLLCYWAPNNNDFAEGSTGLPPCNPIGPETVLETPAQLWGLAGGKGVAMGQGLFYGAPKNTVLPQKNVWVQPTVSPETSMLLPKTESWDPGLFWVGVQGKSNLLYTVGARPRAGGGLYSAPWDCVRTDMNLPSMQRAGPNQQIHDYQRSWENLGCSPPAWGRIVMNQPVAILDLGVNYAGAIL